MNEEDKTIDLPTTEGVAQAKSYAEKPLRQGGC